MSLRLVSRSLPLLAGVLVFGAAGAQSPLYSDAVYVRYAEGADLNRAASFDAAALGGVVVDRVGETGVILRPHRAATPDYAARVLRSRPWVSFAEPDYLVRTTSAVAPDDTYYSTDQYGPQMLRADLLWGRYAPSAIVPVAVIDTGVQLDHPDLADMMFRRNNQIVQADFVQNDGDASDDQGHGTHCAGIVAGEANNGAGIAGTAGYSPNGNSFGVRIMPIKVLDANGSGGTTGVARGITWSVDNGARVVSLSLGGPTNSAALTDAVQYAWNRGVVVVAAAGNSNTSQTFYPAGCPNVISVAALDSSSRLASFSNFGSWVKVAAPGVNIVSTVRGGGYDFMSGTSMACPSVAGVAGMLTAMAPNTSGPFRAEAILNSTRSFTATSKTIGGGLVDANAAMDYVQTENAPLLANLTVSAPNVVPGTSVGFTITTLRAVRTGGMTATLSVTPAWSAMPKTLALSEGTSSATWSVVAPNVARATSYSVRLVAGSENRTVRLNIRPAAVASLTVPATGVSGTTLTGTVTVQLPAPPAGLTVRLAAASPLSGPTTVTIPAGETSATFSLNVGATTSRRNATVTVTLGSSRASRTVQVRPAS